MLPAHLESLITRNVETKDVAHGMLEGFRYALRPLVRMLIRAGVPFGKFADVLKSVYYECAAEDFLMDEKKNSASRIALLTGLSRREVRRQVKTREEYDAGGARIVLHRAGRVLSGWYNDPWYLDQEGKPLALPFDSDEGPSFASLVRKYSCDMTARSILEELSRVDCMDSQDESSLRALKRFYIPAHYDPVTIAHMAILLRSIGNTLDYNINPDRKGPPRTERRVYTSVGIKPEDVPVFRKMSYELGQEVLYKLDDWVIARENEAMEQGCDDRVMVSFNMFYWQNNNDQ